jgi:hypothetical protein
LLSLDQIKAIVHSKALSVEDRLLICLASDRRPLSIQEIRKIALEAGLRRSQDWNISQYLSRSAGLAIRTNVGWELTREGHDRVSGIAGLAPQGAVSSAAVRALEAHIQAISNPPTKEFLIEAANCIAAGLRRAAVVLSWVGAVSVLQDEVIKNHLSAFNAEAVRRDKRWREAKTADDLGRMKEADFLNVLESLSIIGRNVKLELESCLKLRNGCGHPNSLKIGETRVAAHVETLAQNVFAVFC